MWLISPFRSLHLTLWMLFSETVFWTQFHGVLKSLTPLVLLSNHHPPLQAPSVTSSQPRQQPYTVWRFGPPSGPAHPTLPPCSPHTYHPPPPPPRMLASLSPNCLPLSQAPTGRLRAIRPTLFVYVFLFNFAFWELHENLFFKGFCIKLLNCRKILGGGGLCYPQLTSLL